MLRATPGGSCTLDIDGHFAFGGPFSATGGALNAVQFGDENSLGANATAEVAQVDYSLGGAQLTLSNTNQFNLPVGEHGRYTLNVAPRVAGAGRRLVAAAPEGPVQTVPDPPLRR